MPISSTNGAETMYFFIICLLQASKILFTMNLAYHSFVDLQAIFLKKFELHLLTVEWNSSTVQFPYKKHSYH